MRHLTVRVNVAASQLCGPGLADRARQLLDGAGCPPAMLSVEVNEASLVSAGLSPIEFFSSLPVCTTLTV